MAGYDRKRDIAADQRAYVSPQTQVPPQWTQEQEDLASRTAQQPFDGTVNQEFQRAAQASGLSSDVISQIAEQVRAQVVDSLKAEGFAYQPPNEPVLSYLSRQPPSDPDPRPKSRPSPRRGDEDTLPSRRVISQIRSEDPHERHGKRASPSAGWPNQTRPEPQRNRTTEEETILEKIWGPLFDLDGAPTARMGQLLRGIALHIIEDYEPNMSLVIGPSKMRQFYEDVSVRNEVYPWGVIFGTLNYSAICKIYRDLRCEHHLVQGSMGGVPTLPALTPHGFETWMTLMIQGHTDLEFERLAKTLVAFPINNADDRKERLPKELSRRLLPKEDNLRARQRCVAAISAHSQVPMGDSVHFPPPLPTKPPSTQGEVQDDTEARYATIQPPHTDLPRPNGPPSQAVVSEDEDDPPSIPFRERERQPYVAKEGSGKWYDDSPAPNVASSGATETTRTHPRPSSYPTTLPMPTNDHRQYTQPSEPPHPVPPLAAFPTAHQSGVPEPPQLSTSRTRHSTSSTHPYLASTAPIDIPQSSTNPISGSRNAPTAAIAKQGYGTSPKGMGSESSSEFRGRSRASSGSKLGGSGYTPRSSTGSHYTTVSSGSAASERR